MDIYISKKIRGGGVPTGHLGRPKETTKQRSTIRQAVRLGMPETTEATRSPIWADVVAVEVRDWISGIEPRYRLSLGRKFVIEFS